jgi:DNA repair protein RadC
MAEQADPFAFGVSETVALAQSVVDDPLVEARERVVTRGPEALDEGEILALLLTHRLRPWIDACAIADALIDHFGGLGRVVGAMPADLARVAGAAAAQELGLLHALLLAGLERPLRRRSLLTSWDAVQTYLRARLAAAPREGFHVLFLDKKNQLIAEERMGEGTVDHAPVYPREVVRRALELSASALVLAHNHPSGDPAPSSADVEMTKQVVEAAKALGIAVHDHLVIGADQVASLRRLGLM